MSRALAGALAAVVLLTTATSAEAARYTGKASEGTKVVLRTTAKGFPKRVTFGRYKAPCTRGYSAVRNPIGGFKPPFTTGSTRRVLDRGRKRLRRGKFRVRASWRLEARHTAKDHWRGRYRTKGVYRRHGETVTRCSTRFRFDLARR